MITAELSRQIRLEFKFEPTQDQDRAIEAFSDFLFDSEESTVMILRGSAGTGKTALASALVRTLKRLKRKVMLLAPTGRAAKVFAMNASTYASTIHRCIYREKTFAGTDTEFNLNVNLQRETLFIIDEASMISTDSGTTFFGSGRLLDDLIRYVYNYKNCRLLLIGDKAQLPPIGETESPALHADTLMGYGLKVYEADLDEVLRQSKASGILWNATMIRSLIADDGMEGLPKIKLKGFADIQNVRGDELIETIASSYSAVGMDETMIITRSNKRANIFNQGIRNTILDREEQLTSGDMLMIVKNKYFSKPIEYRQSTNDLSSEENKNNTLTFIANGDRAIVRRVRNIRAMYGFNFADVTLEFPDYGRAECDTVVVLDTLTTEAPALTKEQNEKLFYSVLEDYADVSRKSERMKQIREDAYFNAMQIKFGYAITCHKAQGGQWAHIYIDQGYIPEGISRLDYIHWLYTAFTRATERLYLINWPKEQQVDPEED